MTDDRPHRCRRVARAPAIGTYSHRDAIRVDFAALAAQYWRVSAPPTPVYLSDGDSAPDRDFEAGQLRHLVAGNRGRLLDARRTPVRITEIHAAQGTFEVELLDFEDRGAHWLVPFEEAGRYQFERGSQTAGDALVTAYEQAVRRFDRELVIVARPAARSATLARLAAARSTAARWLDAHALGRVELTGPIETRTGDVECARLLAAYLAERELGGIDDAFARAFVSNPRSGDLVKGHAIVLAELGLCSYAGKVTRGADVFSGEWSRERRGEHLIMRLAFTSALWSRTAPAGLPLYRALSSDARLEARAAGSFVSATFSAEVALAHFQGGPSTRSAAILRQVTPGERLLMTFLETRAMSRQFKEAEAVLIGDPQNRCF